MIRPAHCSLYLLYSQEEKNLIPFFLFSLQHFHWLYLFCSDYCLSCDCLNKTSDSLSCSLKIQLEFYHQIYNYMSHLCSSVAGGTPVILLSQGLAASENRKQCDQSSVQSHMILDRGREWWLLAQSPGTHLSAQMGMLTSKILTA